MQGTHTEYATLISITQVVKMQFFSCIVVRLKKKYLCFMLSKVDDFSENRGGFIIQHQEATILRFNLFNPPNRGTHQYITQKRIHLLLWMIKLEKSAGRQGLPCPHDYHHDPAAWN